MSVREVVVLGSASQVPTRYRNHNGYLIRFDGYGVLFDPGEGTQRQMLMANVSATDIHRICITHFHGDHCLGLAGITQRISLDGVPHEVPVHYPKSGQKYFERLRYASIYKDQAKLVPSPISKDGPIGQYKTLTLTARALEHGVPTYGYRLQEADGVRMLPEALKEAGVEGRDIGTLQREGEIVVDGRTIRLEDVSETRRGQSVAVVMDTRPCANAVELARGADLLLCESTYQEDMAKEAHERFHMTARQAATLAREAGVTKLVLTHFSQRYRRAESFVEEASPIFSNVVAAVDGNRVRLPPRR